MKKMNPVFLLVFSFTFSVTFAQRPAKKDPFVIKKVDDKKVLCFNKIPRVPFVGSRTEATTRMPLIHIPPTDTNLMILSKNNHSDPDRDVKMVFVQDADTRQWIFITESADISDASRLGTWVDVFYYRSNNQGSQLFGTRRAK